MRQPTPTDDALFLQWLDGDDAAFRTLFERIAPIILHIARRYGLTEAQAKDAVQNTFLAVHRGAHDFRRGAPLRPWLFTITYNVVRQQRRAQARAPRPLPDDWQLAAPEPEVHRDRGAITLAVRQAIALLPAGQREVVELHWLDVLPFREVARRVGISEGAVRVRAHRGYSVLRRHLLQVPELWEAA